MRAAGLSPPEFLQFAGQLLRWRLVGADILTGSGGGQILLEDPAGNVVKLFQPADR